jgi:hypothetical protein
VLCWIKHVLTWSKAGLQTEAILSSSTKSASKNTCESKHPLCLPQKKKKKKKKTYLRPYAERSMVWTVRLDGCFPRMPHKARLGDALVRSNVCVPLCGSGSGQESAMSQSM